MNDETLMARKNRGALSTFVIRFICRNVFHLVQRLVAIDISEGYACEANRKEENSRVTQKGES
jgi:hypothetical protein